MINQSAAIGKLHFILKTPVSTPPADTKEITSRARENLADTVPPFRWSQEQLAEFVGGGMAELRNMRSDLKEIEDVPEIFSPALANYVTYRALALDNDAQNNNGALSDKYFSLFISQVSAIPYIFTDERLGKYLDTAASLLVSLRPDLRIGDGGKIKENIRIAGDDGKVSYDLPERFADVIIYSAAADASQQGASDMANYFSDKFQGAWRTT
jgi:hypothetical protein